jgi:hypothetical protein
MGLAGGVEREGTTLGSERLRWRISANALRIRQR